MSTLLDGLLFVTFVLCVIVHVLLRFQTKYILTNALQTDPVIFLRDHCLSGLHGSVKTSLECSVC